MIWGLASRIFQRLELMGVQFEFFLTYDLRAVSSFSMMTTYDLRSWPAWENGQKAMIFVSLIDLVLCDTNIFNSVVQ
jgi:hypothetical protein